MNLSGRGVSRASNAEWIGCAVLAKAKYIRHYSVTGLDEIFVAQHFLSVTEPGRTTAAFQGGAAPQFPSDRGAAAVESRDTGKAASARNSAARKPSRQAGGRGDANRARLVRTTMWR